MSLSIFDHGESIGVVDFGLAEAITTATRTKKATTPRTIGQLYPIQGKKEYQPVTCAVCTKITITIIAPIPQGRYIIHLSEGFENNPVKIITNNNITKPIPNLGKISEKNLGTKSNCNAINATERDDHYAK